MVSVSVSQPLNVRRLQSTRPVKSCTNRYHHYDVAAQKINHPDHPAPHEIAHKVIHITTKTLEVSDLIIRTISNTLRSVKEFFKESRFVAETADFLRPHLQMAKTIVIALAPLYLYQFGKDIYDFVQHDIDLGDFLLHSFESLALLTDSIVSFLQDLVTLGELPLEILKYLWPFDVLGIVLSAISLISHARGWHRSASFVKEFEQVMDFTKGAGQLTNDEIDAAVNFIVGQDKKRIDQVLEVDKSDLVKNIEVVATRAKLLNKASLPEEDRIKAQEEFINAMSSLRGRVKSQIVSHQLGVTSSAISVVANSVLFVTPFLLPVFPGITFIMPGLYGVKGIGGMVSFSNLIFKAASKYQLSHTDFMSKKIKPDEKGAIVAEKTAES